MLPQSYFGEGPLADAFRAGRLEGKRTGYHDAKRPRFRPLEEELLIAAVEAGWSLSQTKWDHVVQIACDTAKALRKRMEEDTDGR